MTSGMELIDRIRAEQADPPSGIGTMGLDETHRWLTSMEPGRATFEWTVDDRHLNMEGAVICSWTAALADQAIFFAATSVCQPGETTRMADLRVIYLHNLDVGENVRIRARVDGRGESTLLCTCDFVLTDGRIAAVATAIIHVFE